MALHFFSARRRLEALKAALRHVGECIDARISVQLWDGSVVPLGRDADASLCLAIHSPGVISSLLRRPTLDNLVAHYAAGRLDPQGTDLFTFAERIRVKGLKEKLRGVSKARLAWALLPFLFGRGDHSRVAHRRADGAGLGVDATRRDNTDFVRFHYDVSNEFYELFLDERMQYTCSYFTDPENSLDASQEDKLEMICRKLRLRPGETLLDLGCGWGGLVCYAAQRYGVTAHGVNLSREQVEYARARVKRLGLEGRVTVELLDAHQVTGTYDKVASIGMFEHLGMNNYAAMLHKIGGVVRDRGIVLIHMICRGAKASDKEYRKARPEHRFIRNYIFPGSEVGHVGYLVQQLEAARFEVHDVEGWREHYALTLKHWAKRLAVREEEAVRLVGAEWFRVWMAYLVGTGLCFADGSLRLFQVVASKHAAKGGSALPGTRADLYDRPLPSQALPLARAG